MLSISGRSRIIKLLVAALLITHFSVLTVLAQVNFDIPAESAILVDGNTGQILWQKNAHNRMPPASITKIMTMLLVMEAVDSGRASLEDTVTASSYAESMGGSQVYLAVGEKMALEKIMESIAIASGNDASVAAAEFISGTEPAFVQNMNRRAQELGMRDTIFYNSTGLPEEGEGNLTTAYDIAIMSRELLKHPKVLDWTSRRVDSIRDGKFILHNTNSLIGAYPGADGIKTGHTEEAGYCLSATAERNGVRLVSVVMNTESATERTNQTIRLLDLGFNAFSPQTVVKKGQEVTTLEIAGAKRVVTPVAAGESLTVLVPKGTPDAVQTEFIPEGNLRAPLQAGTRVGKVKVTIDGNPAGEVPVVTQAEVEQANIFVRFFRWVWRAVANLFS